MNISLDLAPQDASVIRQALDVVRKQADFDSCVACIDIMKSIDEAMAKAGADERRSVEIERARADTLKALELIDEGQDRDEVIQLILDDELNKPEEGDEAEEDQADE